MKFEIPKSIREEHAALHSELLRVSREPGPVGSAAEEVMRLIGPHIEKENGYGLPPLALLAAMAEGGVTGDMGEILELTERLKADLPAMLAEHEFIGGALRNLIAAARKNDRVELAELAHRLVHHMRLEEEVLYPASLLVGEYVAISLGLKR